MSKQHRTFCLSAVRRRNQPAAPSGGFKLLELVLVVAIGTVMTAVGLPMIKNTMSNLHLGSAATSLATVIQSARYLAVSSGCPVQIAVSAQSYQLSAVQLTTATPPACNGTAASPTYSYYCGGAYATAACPVTYASSEISLSPSTTQTLQFNPSGIVSPAGNTSVTGFTPQNYSLTLAQTTGTQTKTVSVSGGGYVKVTAP